MPEYLFTGWTAEGKEETSRVEAPSADKAVKLARERGYRDVVLHTDDVEAHYTRHRDVEENISPAEYVGFRYFRGFLDDAVFVAAKIYAAGWLLFLSAAAVVTVRRLLGLPSNWLDYACLVLLALPMVWSLVSQVTNPVHRYHRLIEALAWGRWEEVLARLPGLEEHIPAEEFAFVQAQALAATGRMDEAMKVVKPFADGDQMPAWLYW
ncbi:MAG: hypothetical protein KY475_20075, partial [Planctomycetes bacterium]|nr:hypothetical protein [Planctomycetota bacterium]